VLSTAAVGGGPAGALPVTAEGSPALSEMLMGILLLKGAETALPDAVAASVGARDIAHKRAGGAYDGTIVSSPDQCSATSWPRTSR
jgi:hypothetical protein